MRLIFAKTRFELEEGNKTETRRFPKEKQIERWMSAWKKGSLVHEAWTGIAGWNENAERIGYFELTAPPKLEPLCQMTQKNLKAEGGMCDNVEDFAALVGHPVDAVALVLRFKFLGKIW